MPNSEHSTIVRQGAAAITEWRKANPYTRFDLSHTDLSEVVLSGADLSGAVLFGAHLAGVSLSGANLSGADLRAADLSRARLRGADLSEAELRLANLSLANLGEANLTRVRLVGANLSRANLRAANLAGASLSGANLSEADLEGARLTLANLGIARLNGANLSRASLSGADLAGASLSGANLSGANLSGANLSRTDLNAANLSGAGFSDTALTNCDLSQTCGLDSVIHWRGSPIDILTFIASKGKIPEVFLRGCGIPEEWITKIPSIIGSMEPIRFYSCFISYSHADKPFARRLHDTLQARGIRCWLDEHQLLPGDDPHEQIDRGIRLWDKVLLCASKASLTSWWVDNEIATAFEKERQLMKDRGKKILALIPLDLDGYLFSKDYPNAKQTQLKTRIAAKFAGWDKNNALFEREFERLIKALQTNDAGRVNPPPPML